MISDKTYESAAKATVVIGILSLVSGWLVILAFAFCAELENYRKKGQGDIMTEQNQGVWNLAAPDQAAPDQAAPDQSEKSVNIRQIGPDSGIISKSEKAKKLQDDAGI